MQRAATVSIVQLFVVVHVFSAAGVADAQSMKVACVGDSITAIEPGWCTYLGMKLGSGYTAQSFGVSGTTLLENVGQPSFSSSDQYQPSHDFAPNIVVIMLGTNDSASRNWDAGKDHFVKDYGVLIDSYTSLASKPIVFLNTPPPASDDNMFTISGTTIEKEIIPLIKQVAMTKMCPFVDVWTAFGGDVQKIGSFDGVHPGDAGQMTIADTVYMAIKSPSVPGGNAGMGGSAGSGGSGNAGGGGAGGSANTGGAGGANASGAGGASANTGGTSGGNAGGSANTAAGGNTGSSANTVGSASFAGAGGNSSSVNFTGVAGSVPALVTAPQSNGGGCQMAGNFASRSGPAPVLLFLLGIVMIRSRKRNHPTHRNVAKAIVQLSVVVLIVISAGVANAQTVKVACVGDSITALPSSWCGDLSTKLGSGYMVQNFGVSGTNLAKGVGQPYWDSDQYTPSHDFAPDIVIIMLGTNDAFSFSWSDAKTHFVKDYEDLLDTYTSLPSKPKPYMIIPTPIGTSPFGHDGNLLATEVVPLVKQVAMEKMVPTIDAFTLFGGAMFDAGLYGASDQVHPNDKGQQMICDEVYKVLISTGALGGSGSAGSGATAGRGAMAGSGGIGMGGGAGMGVAGASANAGGAGSGGAGTMNASGAGGGGVNTAGSANGGSSSNAAGSTSFAGAGGSGNAGDNSNSGVNVIGAAGTGAPLGSTANSIGCGCRAAGNVTSKSGPAAVLLLLLGIVIRRRKRNDRERDPEMREGENRNAAGSRTSTIATAGASGAGTR